NWRPETGKVLTIEDFIQHTYEMLPPLTASFEHADEVNRSEREYFDQRPQFETHIAAFREACTLWGLGLRSTGQREYDIVCGAKTIGGLKGTTVSLNSREAGRICSNKSATYRYLKGAAVPVPERRVF